MVFAPMGSAVLSLAGVAQLMNTAQEVDNPVAMEAVAMASVLTATSAALNGAGVELPLITVKIPHLHLPALHLVPVAVEAVAMASVLTATSAALNGVGVELPLIIVHR
jgi:predicted YcjX-like family ATPase